MKRAEQRIVFAKEFVEKANRIHNNKYDYSNVEYINSRTKVSILCPIHGLFEQTPATHIKGCGCPECGKIWTDEHRNNQRKATKAQAFTLDEWIAKARSVHGDKYDYSQVVYENQRSVVKIICPIHGLFEQKADSHVRGFGCKLCGYNSEYSKSPHYWTDEQYEKIAQTCLERYGAKRYLDSNQGRKHLKAVLSSPEHKAKMSKIISSDEIQEKTKQTCLSRYGVTSAMKLESVKEKMIVEKRKRGTFSTSRTEDVMYKKLCDRFGKENVIRQYKDVRYPFNCDFYILFMDLFIELNASWLHNDKWFDNQDADCIKQLNFWNQELAKGKKFYQAAIETWTIRDVAKRKIALKNNLNYVVFWKNDLSDFYCWLESDELIINNIKY